MSESSKYFVPRNIPLPLVEHGITATYKKKKGQGKRDTLTDTVLATPWELESSLSQMDCIKSNHCERDLPPLENRLEVRIVAGGEEIPHS